jgi:hypothetical protein
VAQKYPVPKNFTTIPGTTAKLPLIMINSIQAQVEWISLSHPRFMQINVNIVSFNSSAKCNNIVWTKTMTEEKSWKKQWSVTKNGQQEQLLPT